MHEGAGNVPAYRGLAYLTFDELPLRDFGNRIPNITAEVVGAAPIVHPNQHLDVFGQGVEDYGKAGWILDPGRPYIYNLWSAWLLKIDRVSGQVIFRERVDEPIRPSSPGGRRAGGRARPPSRLHDRSLSRAISSSESAAPSPASMPIPSQPKSWYRTAPTRSVRCWCSPAAIWSRSAAW